jgi:hypothetical protein
LGTRDDFRSTVVPPPRAFCKGGPPEATDPAGNITVASDGCKIEPAGNITVASDGFNKAVASEGATDAKPSIPANKDEGGPLRCTRTLRVGSSILDTDADDS